MYEKLVFPFPKEYNQIAADGVTDFMYQPQAYFRGASQIPGAKYNVGFQVVVKPYFLDRIPHTHDVDEYLIFLGGTFPNLFDFDADIELTIGKPGVDAEVYQINQPTIVRIPAGVYHCPLQFKRVGKPVFFQAPMMDEMFGSIMDKPDGSKVKMRFNGPVPCKYNAEKRCDSCGKCLEEDWR